MSAPFKSGDVVVCVDDRGCRCCGDPVPVSKGAIYRVVDLWLSKTDGQERWAVVLANVPLPQTHAPGINAARFRKIDDEVTEEFVAELRRLSAPKEVVHDA